MLLVLVMQWHTLLVDKDRQQKNMINTQALNMTSYFNLG